MKDVANMSDAEIRELQTRIQTVQAQRFNATQSHLDAEKDRKKAELINGPKGAALRTDYKLLESEFRSMPTIIETDVVVQLKVKIQTRADFEDDFEEFVRDRYGDEDCNLEFEILNKHELPKAILETIKTVLEDSYDTECSLDDLSGYDIDRWKEFIKKADALGARLEEMYDADVDLNELMDS